MAREKIYSVLLLMVALGTRKTLSKLTEGNAVRYLKEFGYINRNPRFGSADDFTAGVRTFQRFAGLSQTGVLDDETLAKMAETRCGVPDIIRSDGAVRKKRYTLDGSKWHKKQLTYKITRYTSDLRKRATEKILSAAFKVWEDNSGLTFKKVHGSQRADIEIMFVRGSHGDITPFDGPGNTFAHAFRPSYGGDVHFDEDETWAGSPGVGRMSLFWVGVHEIGHSLGLTHSGVRAAFMSPFYNPNHSGQLHIDDIKGIRKLYGAPRNKKRPQPRPARRANTRRPKWTGDTKAIATETPSVGTYNKGKYEQEIQRNRPFFADPSHP